MNYISKDGNHIMTLVEGDSENFITVNGEKFYDHSSKSSHSNRFFIHISDGYAVIMGRKLYYFHKGEMTDKGGKGSIHLYPM